MYKLTIEANCIEELYNDVARLAGQLGPFQETTQPDMWVDQPGNMPEPEEKATKKKAEPKPAPEPEAEPEPEEPKITQEQLRVVLAEKTRNGEREAVKKVLASFGASKFTELDEANYNKCYTAIMKGDKENA